MMDAQIAANGLISSSAYILAGISFYLPFTSARFFHFTHGAACAAGAYLAFVLATKAQASLLTASIISVLLLSLSGWILETILYRPMRRTGASALVLLLASLGLYTLVQNSLSLAFEDSALAMPGTRVWSVYKICGCYVTAAQLTQLALSLFVPFCLYIFLRISRVGIYIRAAGQDKNLAYSLGIPVDNAIAVSFAVGYGLAGLAGIVAACNVDLTPTMGMRPMVMGMVAMIIGGNNLWGTVLGATLLGFAQHLGIILLPAQWQDAIAFFILVLFLILRPQGFSTRTKKIKS